MVRGDALPLILHGDDDVLRAGVHLQRDRCLRRRILRCIADQIADALHEAVGVADHGQVVELGQVVADRIAVGRTCQTQCMLQAGDQLKCFLADRELMVVGAAEVQ